MSDLQVKAIAKGIRISPRKVGVVADLVRRRTVADALVILENTERKAAAPIIKLINSAVANARHNMRMNADQIAQLDIQTIMVTEGMTMKRYKFVGAGRRAKPRPMLKRSSHVTLVLSVPNSEPKKAEKTPSKTTPATTAKPASKVVASKTPAKKSVKKAAPKPKEAKK